MCGNVSTARKTTKEIKRLKCDFFAAFIGFCSSFGLLSEINTIRNFTYLNKY